MSAEIIRERYRLDHLLQHRAGQKTYRAQDLQKQTEVIVKVLDLGQIQDWQELEYFDREVQTLAQLEHARIPRLQEHFRTDAQAYLVQEAIAGQTLRELFEQGPLSEERAYDLARQLLEILAYLQALNPPVIHRDIKPENILLDTAGQAYLIDFGAVRDAARQHQLSVAGTFGYMAPEQAAGQVQPASDLYALGATLIEGLSATPPQNLPQDRDLRLQYHDRVQISERFQRWLDLMIEPVVNARPANAREALHWLQAEAPTEAAGRVELSFPGSEQSRIQIRPAEALSQAQLLTRCAANQSGKFLCAWVAWFILLTTIQNMLSPSFSSRAEAMAYINASWPVYNAIYWLVSAGLLAWLGRAEYFALKKNQEQEQLLLLDKEYLYYARQRFPLNQLQQVKYDKDAYFLSAQSSQIYLKFKGQKALRVPVTLNPAERQMFEHAFEQHARKHVPAALKQIEDAQN